jgi:hypothetical protein
VEDSLDAEGGGAVVGVGPRVEFQVADAGVFWIEADYDWFTNGQFANCSTARKSLV